MTERINIESLDYTWDVTYDMLVKTFGEIIAEASDDDYQGDSLYLIRGADGRIGVLTFGWGSCSGCDALEDALYASGDESVQNKVNALQDDLERGIRWFGSIEEARGWLLGEAGSEFYSGSYLREELVEKFKKAVQA